VEDAVDVTPAAVLARIHRQVAEAIEAPCAASREGVREALIEWEGLAQGTLVEAAGALRWSREDLVVALRLLRGVGYAAGELLFAAGEETVL
jgi:hypothetical protein